MLTAERLRELLDYDPETGVFTRRVDAGSRGKAGSVAGGYHSRGGYLEIGIDGRVYYSHRLAILYVTGEWPTAHVDHINNVKDDNRFANLREATKAQNATNSKRRSDNTSGFKGVGYDPRRRRWVARIRYGGRTTCLGRFKTPDAAHAAYRAAAQELHGEFARMT
jgi:hypothetical protein